ncbi:MAG: dCMP deaminase family protein [Elusimicrobiota bacterium]
MKDGRITKHEYYLNIAKEVARRSTCLRRHYGAVIVNNDQIVSTGYAGSPRGTANCSEIGTCLRIQLHAKRGEHYEWCRAVHAEQNAIIHASRFDMIGATLYLVGVSPSTSHIIKGAEPCKICKRMIINSGIARVIVLNPSSSLRVESVKGWIRGNMGDFKKVRGKLIPVMPRGY